MPETNVARAKEIWRKWCDGEKQDGALFALIAAALDEARRETVAECIRALPVLAVGPGRYTEGLRQENKTIRSRLRALLDPRPATQPETVTPAREGE